MFKRALPRGIDIDLASGPADCVEGDIIEDVVDTPPAPAPGGRTTGVKAEEAQALPDVMAAEGLLSSRKMASKRPQRNRADARNKVNNGKQSRGDAAKEQTISRTLGAYGIKRAQADSASSSSKAAPPQIDARWERAVTRGRIFEATACEICVKIRKLIIGNKKGHGRWNMERGHEQLVMISDRDQ